jgi:hypothetical protein
MTKRVLLDEGVPRHLAAPLEAAGFSCTPYPRSWKQMKNGELLRLAERQHRHSDHQRQEHLRATKFAWEKSPIIVLPINLCRRVMERAADIIDTINRIK